MALYMVSDLLRLVSGVNARGFLKVGVLPWKVSVLIVCWRLDYAFEQHRNSGGGGGGVFIFFLIRAEFSVVEDASHQEKGMLYRDRRSCQEKRVSSNCDSLSCNFSGAILYKQEIKSEPFIKGWLQPSHVTWQF